MSPNEVFHLVNSWEMVSTIHYGTGSSREIPILMPTLSIVGTNQLSEINDH